MVQEQSNMREGTVLTVPNHHIGMSGNPPGLTAGRCYTAYFENQHGEQMVFQFDHETKKGTLWYGDYSWENPFPVMCGMTTLILDHDVQAWLRLVWETATRHEPRSFHLRSVLDLIHACKAALGSLLSQPDFPGDSLMGIAFPLVKKQMEKLEKDIRREMESLGEVVEDGKAEEEPCREEGDRP